MTSLLRALTPLPKRSAASSSSTSRPRRASSRATAMPITPAPITPRRRCPRSGSVGRDWRDTHAAVQCRLMSAVHYRLEDGVAVLTIDNAPVNALSLAVRAGLLQALERAAHDDAVRAVVLTGAHGNFAAGADIREIASGAVLKSPITREVQARMEALGKPLVAAIEGVALGGGFELALTCHWRLARRDAGVGLPEVKLGLIPGAGGTQRFPRLAGPAAALEAITSG